MTGFAGRPLHSKGAPMHPSIPILQADRLSFGYPHPPGPLLLEQFSLAVGPGVTFVCGDEGSGKTTLLRLLAGLPMALAQGELRIKGVSLADHPERYRQQVAWLDPRDTALDQQTARQIFASLPRSHPDFDPDALALHAKGLSLAPHLDKALFMMSTGTRRKVLVAGALACGAPVTLLDQPFMALDRPSIDYLLAVLAQAARHSGRTWVVADYERPAQLALAGLVQL